MVPFHRVAAAFLSICCTNVMALSLGGRQFNVFDAGEREALQNMVTWDEHSLFVRGERIMFYSGEFHPWRLPVPGLWLDVLQKIKALGYTGVSIYVDWALHEGNPGHFTAEGVFSWEPFFEAAAEAGLYVLARPGPYINAEVAGGGFPGWLQKTPAILRTNESRYVDAIENYVANIGKIIADAQITNGGPVIAFQPENEYTFGASWVKWPDVEYISYVNEQFRSAGIVVPFINNEAAAIGLFTPPKPGGPDIYGHDSYPIGFDCSNPSVWPAGNIPTYFRQAHLEQSPSTPYTIPEFQGGALSSWGGWDIEQCATLTNYEFERIFYKNDFSFGVTIFNIYMTYGGTNWGNLGQPGGFTSYDYGSAIREDRTLFREKYAEGKLIAQFIAASPAYLEATPGNFTNTTYVNTTGISTTPIFGNKTTFYVTRHSAYESLASTPYILTVPTSFGNVTIPQLGGSLTLNGRDSKIHVTDYDVGGHNLIYSSADIFTHGSTGTKRVLLLYGLAGETHEFAFPSTLGKSVVEGDSSTVKIETKGSAVIVQWEVTAERKVLHYGSNLDVYLLWRNDAFNYWVLELEAPAPLGNFTSHTKDTVIAKAGYLLRTATKTGTSLYLTGDLNATAELEIIAGLPGSNNIYFNGAKVPSVKSANGRLSATLTYTAPEITIPDIAALDWKYIDSLPEIQSSYDDSAWTPADQTSITNNARDGNGDLLTLKTPTSLFAGGYGYHTGSIIYRGHFIAHGNESSLYLSTQGGGGFAHAVWLNSTFLGSWAGNASGAYNQTLDISPGLLRRGQDYVITVVLDHMGEETNWTPGYDTMKTVRGILDFALAGHEQADVAWRLTGNLGGEAYADQTRGPLNEGGMFAERLGYHLPRPPSEGWESGSPVGDGMAQAGIGFFASSFELDVPAGYDVPMSFVFANSSVPASSFRVQLFVNGYQFGKYVNNLGPQTTFPVPQGILNYSGTNYIALTLWALKEGGAKLEGLQLVADAVIQSGFKAPELSPQIAWEEREDAY